MLELLPSISFCLWIFGLRRRGFGWRKALLFASIPWFLFVVYSTEFLSGLQAVSQFGISVAWLFCAILAAAWFAVGRRTKPDVPGNDTNAASFAPSLDKWDGIALWLVAGFVAVAGATAVVCAPNNWDAMEYHLPRVIQWIGNRSVAFYPTIDRQQLSMPPLTEYVMLHLYLLFGSDRLVNLVQWFGYGGCILAISLLAEELGADRKSQAFAAVLGATMPPALLAASGAKNDDLLAYWIVVTVYLLVAWKKNQSWWLTLAIGASGSLALFSKGTAYVFLPCLFMACWMIWTGSSRLRFLLRLPVLALVLLSVCGPLWLRNHQMTGSVLGLPYFDGAGSNEQRMFATTHLGPAQAMAGVMRNIAIDTSVPSQKVNDASTRVLSRLIRAIGVDPNDDGQIFRAQSGRVHPFAIHFAYRDETLAASQWDALLFLAACILYLKNYKTIGKEAGWFAFGVIGAFILFSVLLRWGPWNGKYQLPVFALAVAFIAIVLPRVLPVSAIRSITFALLVLSAPLCVMNYTRPWVQRNGLSETLFKLPRERTYFLEGHGELADSFIAAANASGLKSCRSIGLDATMLRFEYPMMALLLKQDPSRRFQYMAVNNPTVQYQNSQAEPPCAVICLGCAGSSEKLQVYGTNSQSDTFGTIVDFSNGGRPVLLNGAEESTRQAP